MALGGLGHVGMNATAFSAGGGTILVDCGVRFDDRGLGVDVVHPAFERLDALGSEVRALVLTHAHEDHLGAVPYFLATYDVPVYGPEYALRLLRHKAWEHELLEYARFIPIRPGEKFEIGAFSIEPVRVTHSIADATALVIESGGLRVVHSGDFKVDPDPTDGEHIDVQRLRAAGDAGVDLLFSDSTNILGRGRAGSEAGVRSALEPIVQAAPGAVLVTLFSSNAHRLAIVGELARVTGRKLLLAGRSVETHAGALRDVGRLSWPSDLVWPIDRARELPRDEILCIASGSQGEPRGAISRIVRGEFRHLGLDEGDTVIFSSRAIPGRETDVARLVDHAIRKGAEVCTSATHPGIHVSGHARRDEQTEMLSWVRPKTFVPIHGTLQFLTEHAKLARSLGVPRAHVFEVGEIGELGPGGVERVERIEVPIVHRSRRAVISQASITERRQLAEEGAVFVSFAVDASGERISDVRITLAGITGDLPDTGGVEACMRAVEGAWSKRARAARSPFSLDELWRVDIVKSVRRALARLGAHKPRVFVHVVGRPGSDTTPRP